MGWLVTAGWFLSGSLAAVRCGWVIRGAQKAEGGKKEDVKIRLKTAISG